MESRLDLIRQEHVRMGLQGPELFGRAAAAIYAFGVMEAVEKGTPRQRRAYQQDRIAALLESARAQSPFWAARIPRGRTDLSRLPLLTRAQLRDQVDAEGPLPVAPEHGGIIESATSGSTSQPLRFFVTTLAAAYNEGRYAYDDVVGGRDLTRPFTMMHRDFAETQQLDRWPSLTGEVWRTGPAWGLPVTGISVERLATEMVGRDVGHFLTRPPFLAALLDHVAATGQRPGRIGDILTIGEDVSLALRQRAREVLGARIVDRYSCEEVGPIAFQCPTQETHYHVATSNLVLEVVDDRGRAVEDGRSGHLLVTSLIMAATPVLRYDLGDMGRLLPRCPCGHGGPTLTALSGRRRALLRTPDGRRHFYRMESGALLDIAPVEETRLLQTAADLLVLQVTATRMLMDSEKDALAAVVAAKVPAAFTVRVDQLPAIDWGPSGKRPDVLNLLDDPIG